MRNRPMIGAALLSAVFSYVGAANADEAAPAAAQCAEAFESSQRLSQAGKLQGALEQLIVCAQPTCPAFLTRECATTFERIRLSLPTVTLVATDAQGSPLPDVVVSIDGNRVTDRIAGLAVPVDPGLHEFVFERPGDPPVTINLLISEGEKNKRVVAVLGPPAPAPASVAVPPPVDSAPPPPRKANSGVPMATYVFGGIGVAALGVGGAFRVIGAADYNALAEDCETRCTDAQVDPVKTKYTISNIGLGVGAAALVTAGVFWFIDGNSGTSERASALRFQAGPMYLEGGGAAGVITGAF